ncbi:hypothetical protein TNCV_3555131 [Trichonephila clavipes]|nr:hypothetical protein TNCV_3555131 [Trichonephila clavipes]
MGPTVHEQMFRSGGQPDAKPPKLSPRANLIHTVAKPLGFYKAACFEKSQEATCAFENQDPGLSLTKRATRNVWGERACDLPFCAPRNRRLSSVEKRAIVETRVCVRSATFRKSEV